MSSYAKVNLNRIYNLPNLKLSIRVENLFDEKYQEIYGYKTLGRSIYGGIGVAF
ncbi:TonB-dependent receptor [candidate division WOR-3 bacterium]|nr:TonB-dependent receptor [candidate division WOR-3 bacterium]